VYTPCDPGLGDRALCRKQCKLSWQHALLESTAWEKLRNLSKLNRSSPDRVNFLKGVMMKETLSLSKIVLIAVAVLGFAVSGCERRGADQGAPSGASSSPSSSGTSGAGGTGASGTGTSSSGSK